MDSCGARANISVVITVRNDRTATGQTLDALIGQTRPPDEVIVVDGGSADGTVELLRQFEKKESRVKLIEAPGVNIAAGRNIGVREAIGEIIATTDAGCVLAPNWLEELTNPFRSDPSVEFVAGFYKVEGKTLLERVVGLSTMRGQLEAVDPKKFNPSARSMAFTKEAWRRAGGFPEWIRYSEDTLFDRKMRAIRVEWRFAPEAVVLWRPRSSLRSIARQFYNYGTGRGHTQIDAESFRFNLRNAALTMASLCACLFTPWAILSTMFFLFYFYVVAFHAKSMRVAQRLNRGVAYPVCLVVMWVVVASNTAGFVVGTFQRVTDDERYRKRMAGYLAVPYAS